MYIIKYNSITNMEIMNFRIQWIFLLSKICIFLVLVVLVKFYKRTFLILIIIPHHNKLSIKRKKRQYLKLFKTKYDYFKLNS